MSRFSSSFLKYFPFSEIYAINFCDFFTQIYNPHKKAGAVCARFGDPATETSLKLLWLGKCSRETHSAALNAHLKCNRKRVEAKTSIDALLSTRRTLPTQDDGWQE